MVIDLGSLAEGIKQGASVSVSGVCLTVAAIDGSKLAFDMMEETLEKTTLGSLKVGDLANIERSITVDAEIGGHRVSGHVTGVAEIINLDTPPNNHILTFKCDPTWMDYILPKGFIALDGCSLTVVDVMKEGGFTIHLIPETLRITTFGEKKVGDWVNLEIDSTTQAIVETVKKYLTQK